MTENPLSISIVSPVYKAENIIDELVEEVEKVTIEMGLSYEIILVDDRSPDNSWGKMTEISSKNSNVKSVRLSRNFGQHPAIMAGLSIAKGNWVVVMDCDLQDRPEEIPLLYQKAQEGFPVVLAKRTHRTDGKIKKLSSALFYKFYRFLSGVYFDNKIANFGIYQKKVIKEVLRINDYQKTFPLFVKWLGFNVAYVDVKHGERLEGKSSYSIIKLFKLAFNSLISFSNKPLSLVISLGAIITFVSFGIGLYYLYRYFTGRIEVAGFASLIISIWFLAGITITIIGMVGVYIGKIFDQTKNRPVYVIDETLNL